MKPDAPKKIYVPTCPLSESGLEEFWVNHKTFNDDVEYTRTDAFIEKACEWLSKHFYDGCYQFYDNDGMWIDADSMIEDFKNYMKGE